MPLFYSSFFIIYLMLSALHHVFVSSDYARKELFAAHALERYSHSLRCNVHRRIGLYEESNIPGCVQAIHKGFMPPFFTIYLASTELYYALIFSNKGSIFSDVFVS